MFRPRARGSLLNWQRFCISAFRYLFPRSLWQRLAADDWYRRASEADYTTTVAADFWSGFPAFLAAEIQRDLQQLQDPSDQA